MSTAYTQNAGPLGYDKFLYVCPIHPELSCHNHTTCTETIKLISITMRGPQIDKSINHSTKQAIAKPRTGHADQT